MNRISFSDFISVDEIKDFIDEYEAEEENFKSAINDGDEEAIDKLRAFRNEWGTDYEEFKAAYSEIENYDADTLIHEDEINTYIIDRFIDSNDIPDNILYYLDTDAIVNDILHDYNYVTIFNTDYYFAVY